MVMLWKLTININQLNWHLKNYVEPAWCDVIILNVFDYVFICVQFRVDKCRSRIENKNKITIVANWMENRYYRCVRQCGIKSNPTRILIQVSIQQLFFWFWFYENDPISIYSVRKHSIWFQGEMPLSLNSVKNQK